MPDMKYPACSINHSYSIMDALDPLYSEQRLTNDKEGKNIQAMRRFSMSFSIPKNSLYPSTINLFIAFHLDNLLELLVVFIEATSHLLE